MRSSERVRRLVLMESLLAPLPGAEAFRPQWWFGFHAVPGLAETVLAGHEREYVEWFLRAGTHDGQGVGPAVRDAFVSAYTGDDSLRCGFEYYRAFPANATQIRAATATSRLAVPTLAIGTNSVGDALHRQLEPITDALTGHVIPNCGHIIPLDQPNALLDLLVPFLASTELEAESDDAGGPSHTGQQVQEPVHAAYVRGRLRHQ
jgi:pimeloyl-ACP methyl ester carboxylesterase